MENENEKKIQNEKENKIKQSSLFIFLTFWHLEPYTAGKSGISPLLTILVLRNTRIHISFSDSYNILFYIKISINKTLSLCIILRVPNVNPYNSYIRLGKDLDNIRIEC